MEPVTICAANGYNEKYYFNPVFDKIPESVKEELKIICVLFTDEVGGIITLGFDEEGELQIKTDFDENDFNYDEIASGLLVSKIRATRQELFESLSLFYRVVVLGEDIEEA
ncbi:MAG: DUF6145 family protein [Lachnospiraceae bacterium]|nr:hypothetical protein [Lachnospiraceae bacterium]MCR5311934.1 DUF6145 family protein [Lachnospiraceae bacterium]